MNRWMKIGIVLAGAELMYGTAVFLMVALAPTSLALWFIRKSRRVWSWFTAFGLAFATAIELVIAACALAHYPLPWPPFRGGS